MFSGFELYARWVPLIINKLSNYPINATSFFDLLEPREIVNLVLFFFT